MKTLLTALSVFFLLLSSFSQERTSDSAIMKNSIRVNLSNPFVFGRKAIILGYERQLANNKSFSINIGGMSLPRLKYIGNSTQDSVILLQNNSDGGFHFSTDFRFYLKKENKFAQPHGLYIGHMFYTTACARPIRGTIPRLPLLVTSPRISQQKCW